MGGKRQLWGSLGQTAHPTARIAAVRCDTFFDYGISVLRSGSDENNSFGRITDKVNQWLLVEAGGGGSAERPLLHLYACGYGEQCPEGRESMWNAHRHRWLA